MKLIFIFVALAFFSTAIAGESDYDRAMRDFRNAVNSASEDNGDCDPECFDILVQSAQAIIDRNDSASEKFRRALCQQYTSAHKGSLCSPKFKNICEKVMDIENVKICIEKIKEREAIKDSNDAIRTFNHDAKEAYGLHGKCNQGCVKKLAQNAKVILDRQDSGSALFRRTVCQQYFALQKDRVCLPEFQNVCGKVEGIDAVTACQKELKSLGHKAKSVMGFIGRQGARILAIPGSFTVGAGGLALAIVEGILADPNINEESAGEYYATHTTKAIWRAANRVGKSQIKGEFKPL